MAKIYTEVKDSISIVQVEKIEAKQQLKLGQSHLRVTYVYWLSGIRHLEFVEILFHTTLYKSFKKIIATSGVCNVDAAKYLLDQTVGTLMDVNRSNKQFYVDNHSDELQNWFTELNQLKVGSLHHPQ